MSYYKRSLTKAIHIPTLSKLSACDNQSSITKMESLHSLALRAVPAPDQAAELFFPPHHPLYADLKDRAYREMRALFQKEHKEGLKVSIELAKTFTVLSDFKLVIHLRRKSTLFVSALPSNVPRRIKYWYACSFTETYCKILKPYLLSFSPFNFI